jgi:hypothetical protein
MKHTHHHHYGTAKFSLFAMSVWQRLLLAALALLPLWLLVCWAQGGTA